MEQILFTLHRPVFRSAILFLALILSAETAKTQDSLDLVKISQATNVEALQKYSLYLKNTAELKKRKAYEAALQKGWMITKTGEDGSGIGLKELDKTGKPVYFYTGNLNSAKTVSSNKVWTGGGLGFNLTGAGITLREWDQSQVRATHQELTGRVVIGDGSVGLSAHSTHVAGTMIATGIDANAHGMSKLASLRDFDWDYDYAEMASEAAAGMLLSNHSYVYITGWYNAGSWYWYGDTTINRYTDSYFGFYGDDAKIVDSIAFNAPYYLVCRAAGNDRGEGPATQPVTHYVWNGTTWITSSTIRNNDGMPSGYDCITNGFGTCKNTMTVGAVSAIPAGYSSPGDVVLASFSCTGPTDDGRIKPDIVADGVGLYSTYSSANNAYAYMTGTSMATPSCAGSLCLLQEHYHNLKGVYMRAATLKALAIHTADEAGSYPGPDYKFGWGLLNTAKAATLLSNTTTAKVKELTLTSGTTYTLNFKANGTEALRATICWTDPPGTPPPPSLNPPNLMLVNDLDLRIDGQTYKPWILDPASPASGATTGDNIRDNTEQIYISSIAAGCHTLTVTHKGILTGGSQAFSLILSGITVYPDFTAGNASGNQTICSNAIPSLLSATQPVGGNPPYTYQWQNSTDSINFNNIPGANGLTYQPGPLTVKTFYRQVQSATGSCDNANTNILRILVNPAPIPTISGNSNLCANSGYYAYTTEPGMTNYIWSITSGGTIAAGLGTNVIQVTWNASGAQSVSVNYFNSFGCQAPSATVLAVQVNTIPPAAGTITGIPLVCQGDSGLVYSLTPVANAAAYIWTLPSGAEIISGYLTNSIIVKYSKTALSGNYTVAPNNICGNGTPSPPYPVTVNLIPPAPVIVQQGDSLVSDAPAGNQWYGPNGLLTGATGQTCIPSQNGNYYDIVTLNGCSSDPSNTINFVLTGTGNSNATIPRIFPNPAGNMLHVELFLEHSSTVSLSLMNITGMTVKTIDYGFHARGPIKLIFDCTDLKGGIYFLKVTTESSSFVHKIILEK